MYPIFDLHCDLLCYLISEGKTPLNPEVRCSFPQMKKGNVQFQALAVFTQTKKGSSILGAKQFEAFRKTTFPSSTRVQMALENASSLIEEDEDLDHFFTRYEKAEKEFGPFLYMSLTWNDENRFGGGNLTEKGLKHDGETLLEFMAEKGLLIDLSHTSDPLAYGILNTIDKKGLSLTPIASHSNFRSVTNERRNLNDEIASEIIRRKGLIGLNLVRRFIGEPFEETILKHVIQAKKLGALDTLCFGADFFYEGDIPPESQLRSIMPFFDERYGDSSCYPKLLSLFKEVLSDEEIKKVAYQNCENFLQVKR